MNLVAIAQALVLLTAANGAPVIAKKIFGSWLARPIDGGARFADGRAWLGPTKTIRGIAASIAVTSALAPAIGIDWRLGLAAAVASMAGDLSSSFIKRRLAFAPSSQAPGLDQIPESLLPLLVLSSALSLSAVDILAGTLVFWIGALALSRVLHRIGLRDRPY